MHWTESDAETKMARLAGPAGSDSGRVRGHVARASATWAQSWAGLRAHVGMRRGNGFRPTGLAAFKIGFSF